MGEGSNEIKGFPKFQDLDEIWGTRDSITPKYVVDSSSSDELPPLNDSLGNESVTPSTSNSPLRLLSFCTI